MDVAKGKKSRIACAHQEQSLIPAPSSLSFLDKGLYSPLLLEDVLISFWPSPWVLV